LTLRRVISVPTAVHAATGATINATPAIDQSITASPWPPAAYPAPGGLVIQAFSTHHTLHGQRQLLDRSTTIDQKRRCIASPAPQISTPSRRKTFTMFGFSEEQIAWFGLTFGIGAFMLYMLFIIAQLAWESKAGKFGTFVLFLALAFGMTGFIAKEIIVWIIEK
jgi:hypothetical protein